MVCSCLKEFAIVIEKFLIMDKKYKYDVFISYSRKDMPVADRIAEAFDEQGITYFIDRQGIGGGIEFPAQLARAIKASKVFLFLASKNSYESKFTQTEIVYAFNKKQKHEILPFIIDGSTFPEELEFTFSAINWRNLKEHPIKTVLVDDVLRMVGKERKKPAADGDEIVTPQPKNQLIPGIDFNGKTVGWMVLATSVILLLIALAVMRSHNGVIRAISILSLVILSGVSVLGLMRPASLCLSKRAEVCKFYLASLVLCFIAYGTNADLDAVEEPEIAVDQEEVVVSPEEPAVETMTESPAVATPAPAPATTATPAGSNNPAANNDYMDAIEAANALQQSNKDIIEQAGREAAELMY